MARLDLSRPGGDWRLPSLLRIREEDESAHLTVVECSMQRAVVFDRYAARSSDCLQTTWFAASRVSIITIPI